MSFDLRFCALSSPFGELATRDACESSFALITLTRSTTDTSSLGNLIVLSEALGRAASLQAWTAASDSASRVSALGAALLASIALVSAM